MTAFFEYHPVDQAVLVLQLAGAALVWWVFAVLVVVAIHVG